MDVVGSINADRRPDYRDAIMASEFQDTTCPNCEQSFRIQPDFSYLDAGRGQWIASFPAARLPEYLTAEDDAVALFDTSYGKRAPKAAQTVGAALTTRLTFGWPAIREKLFIRDNDLDDVVIEMVKLDVLRRVPSAPLKPGTELRLVGVTDETLVMVWTDTLTEAVTEELLVPRGLYDAIAANDEWAATRDKLTDGPFVDMQKLYMGPGRAAGAA